MRGILIRWVTTAFALWLTSQVISGIEVRGVAPLFFGAVVLGVLNALVRPLVLFITLPINLVTLGLFTFVINGAMLKLTASVVGGFTVEGFWSAVVGALLLSVISFLASVFVSDSGRVEYIYIERSHPPR